MGKELTPTTESDDYYLIDSDSITVNFIDDNQTGNGNINIMMMQLWGMGVIYSVTLSQKT